SRSASARTQIRPMGMPEPKVASVETSKKSAWKPPPDMAKRDGITPRRRENPATVSVPAPLTPLSTTRELNDRLAPRAGSRKGGGRGGGWRGGRGEGGRARCR